MDNNVVKHFGTNSAILLQIVQDLSCVKLVWFVSHTRRACADVVLYNNTICMCVCA